MKKSHYQEKETPPSEDLEVKKGKKPKRPNFVFTILTYVLGIIVVVSLSLIAWLNFQGRPLSSDKEKFDYFEIKTGDSTRAVAGKLQSQNLVRSDTTFYILAKLSGGPICAGYYKISPSMTNSEILEKFQKAEVDAYSITIPEGYRNLQIAKLFQEKAGIEPTKFIGAATGSEGTLFPDTYVLPSNTEPAKIVKLMKENYEKRTANLKVTSDQLILASIIEREAINDEERPQIAAVYTNRLSKNMLLQADPTIRYGLDSQKYLETKSVDFTFWQGISRGDYQNLNSSFNTYKNKNLPPAPICNPGLKSIEAAQNPTADFDYLFFFHDKDRKIHFAKTYEEHLKLIQEFGLP